MMLKLHTIICSTRPGPRGPVVAQWFHQLARQHNGFDAALVDLAEVNLPLFDEPEHPVLQRYRHDHTKRWAASVNAADAYVFVTPEYNFGPPAPSAERNELRIQGVELQTGGHCQLWRSFRWRTFRVGGKNHADHIENDADGPVRQREEYCHPYRCEQQFPTERASPAWGGIAIERIIQMGAGAKNDEAVSKPGTRLTVASHYH
nr:NAD(P)H-dependent oxidoreductase [Nitrosospira sp. Nsp14]